MTSRSANLNDVSIYSARIACTGQPDIQKSTTLCFDAVRAVHPRSFDIKYDNDGVFTLYSYKNMDRAAAKAAILAVDPAVSVRIVKLGIKISPPRALVAAVADADTEWQRLIGTSLVRIEVRNRMINLPGLVGWFRNF